MNAVAAKKLLKQVKEAEFTGLFGLPELFLRNEADPIRQQQLAELQSVHNKKLQEDAVKTIAKTVLLAGGLGAAIRGYTGLSNLNASKKRKPVGRSVEMPVAYLDKQSLDKAVDLSLGNDNSKATSLYGLDYFIPGMLLGAPLAAYGGWKGVDAILNKQREKEVETKLEQAKAEYEKALFGAYKQSTDESLDLAFEACEKTAEPGFFESIADYFSPNLSGAATGLGTAYTLATLPLGYHIVNKVMQKNSKRALLQKAVEERARRQAREQPPEIYAIPTPFESELE